ncbi:MAG: response regulator transcription factor [bacterium]|nr:response regulator transcription factor [bacterium]
MAIRVALAEDKPFLAQALEDKLKLFPDTLEFIFWAKDGKDLLDRLTDHPGVDVVLMDIEMPVMDGIEATDSVCERFPHVKVIMFTVFDDEHRIFKAIEAGAMGYLLKDEPPQAVHDAIVTMTEGGAPMSPTIAAKSLQLLRDPSRGRKKAESKEFSLTKREVEVLEQLSQGLEYQEIAGNLFISPATVRKHIENIYRKLQVNNKMRAVKKATRHGLI